MTRSPPPSIIRASAFLIALGASSTAFARPSGYSAATCDGGATTNICVLQVISGTDEKWVCDTRVNGETESADIIVIYGGPSSNICDGEDSPASVTRCGPACFLVRFAAAFSSQRALRVLAHPVARRLVERIGYAALPGKPGSFPDYCAFGNDAAGNDCYCDVTDADIIEVWSIGSDDSAADSMEFHYTESSIDYDLNTHDSSTPVVVTGIASGRDGPDDIEGSRVSSSHYFDRLHGDDGADTIYGWAGDDTIHGNAGDDAIYGGDGDDLIYGNGGDDTVSGEGDDDTIHGGDGNDSLSGNGGVDVINGNAGDDGIAGGTGDDSWLDGNSGDDDVCGDGGVDIVHGGTGDDVLWVETGTTTTAEEANGGPHTTGDICQDDGNYTTDCETENSSMLRPGGCP